jgi:hypothetical protein
MNLRRHLATLGFLLTAVAAAAACEDGSPDTPCVQPVPPGACPADGTVDVCSDPGCSAIYACQGGTWKLDHTCPANAQDGGADGGYHAPEASSPSDAAIDAPPGAFGGPGCVDLEPPDCPLGVALGCTSQDCCGCGDLYVCVSGGWNLWGQCVDGGVVMH